MEQIQALKFDVEEVGKHVKGSKKRYTWEISLKNKQHVIVLDFSFISGKVKITVDRKILLENELPANVSFQYPFTLDGFALNIIQQGETFELRINNKVFSHLYTQQKTNTEFKKYEEEVKDIKVNLAQLNPPNKKISLNIGALGPQKKKKQATGQSAGWDAFSGGSFPNYFGQAPQVSQKKSPQRSPTGQPKIDLLGDEEKTQVSQQNNLLQNVTESKKQESFFDLAPQVIKNNNSEQFGNMQQMFTGLNLNSQPNNEIDFFAEEPKKESSPPPQTVTQIQSSTLNTFSFEGNFPASGHVFSTGFAFDQVQTNPKQFSTTVGSKPSDLNFLNPLPPKQEISLGNAGFGKKPSAEIQPAQKAENNASNLLTDISVNDFINQKTAQSTSAVSVEQALDFNMGGLEPQKFGTNQNAFQQPPQASDFSTMQLLFQTNSVGQNNFGAFNQTNATNLVPQPQPNLGFTLPTPSNSAQSPNEAQFNTMRNFFQTTNYENLAGNRPQAVDPKALPDFLKNNKPDTFATMGGVGANGGFNMAAFGTMQMGQQQKTTTLEFNFLEKKPSTNTSNGAGNLI